jgi:hypothetical protein
LIIDYHNGEKVELQFAEAYHSYMVGKELVPSVTQACGIISKPALVPWALKEGVEWLAKNLSNNSGIDFLSNGIKTAYKSTSTDALNIGTVTHEWVEKAIRFHLGEGEEPKMPKQKEAQTAIKAFQSWLQENEVEWHGVEQKIYHRDYKYAGTVDAIATINGEYAVIDWKTSKRIYPEYHLQVSAYAKAVEDIEGKPVDATYILRCDKKTGKFQSVRSEDIEENFLAFRCALHLHRRMKELR